MPGQVTSLGVPRSLNIRFSWSSTSLPGNKGRPALANSEKKKDNSTYQYYLAQSAKEKKLLCHVNK
jgi:hypothetical protein